MTEKDSEALTEEQMLENRRTLRREALARERKLIKNIEDISKAIESLKEQTKSDGFEGFPRAAEILFDLGRDDMSYYRPNSMLILMGAVQEVYSLADRVKDMINENYVSVLGDMGSKEEEVDE